LWGDAVNTDRKPSTEYTFMVMLVDDQPIVAEAVRRMLVNEPDIDFHYCDDAVGASAVAARIMPTLILQDLVMPGLDGLTVLRQYRMDPLTVDIPVIVLSTKEDPAIKSEAFAAGANDYLVKLPDPIELIARIRHHSRARVNQLQRDEAYRALRQSQQELTVVNRCLQETTEALRIEATYDALSGLLNRRAFFDNFFREMARTARYRTSVAVLMADIDRFKEINDGHGHLAGDVVIKEVSLRIRAAVRASDAVGRYGGEEFIVLAAQCDVDRALDLADRFRRDVCEAPIEIPGDTIAVTISVGVAAGSGAVDGEALLRAADEALYRAKQAGRNRTELQLIA
jgi:two-component system chemotaxis family response regulator WspR